MAEPQPSPKKRTRGERDQGLGRPPNRSARQSPSATAPTPCTHGGIWCGHRVGGRRLRVAGRAGERPWLRG